MHMIIQIILIYFNLNIEEIFFFCNVITSTDLIVGNMDLYTKVDLESHLRN